MWMFLFLVLPLAGLWYVLWHLWCLLPLAAPYKWTVIVLCLLTFSTSFLNFSHVTDSVPMPVAKACYEVGNSAIFILLYTVLLFLLLDIGRLVGIVPRTWLYSNLYTLATVVVVLVGIFTYGYFNYMNKQRHTVELPTVKTTGDSIRMVLASDLHLGYHNNRAELARWVDMINAEHPDIVIFAGDIVDRSLRPLHDERMADEFKRINAPVFACLGNHEYYSGISGSIDFYRDAGITLLRDSSVAVGNVVIIGRDDRTNRHRKSLGSLMRGVDKSKYIVLLDHQPYHLEQAEHSGVDFQFSGHTHNGQLWPISLITEAVYEDAYGPWRRGSTRYYVSSGLGIWGAKFRIGTCSEYVVATIKPQH